MDGIHDVLETVEWTVHHEMDVLAPMGTAHEDDVIGGVAAYLADNFGGIALDAGPRVLNGFVVYLVDDMWIVPVALCQRAEELTGFGGVHVVGVPVDDDIEVLLNGSVNDSR